VFDRAGKVVDRASGTFAFARPGKFRWTYEKPHKQVLVGDGTKLWIHDPDLNQVSVKRIDAAVSSTPAALLAGKDDITALFTLRDAGSAEGLSWVEATPKAQDTGFERVRLGLSGKTLAAMELQDQLGGRTMLRFLDLKANAAVPPDTFKFTPPKGADVIEDAPAKAR
jgi:outer membrane lipoprotein carrier protein